MDLYALLLLLAVIALVVLFVTQPLQDRSQRRTESRRELSTLLAERDKLLASIQELDFDHTLGKIPEEDYSGQRAFLLQRGASILRDLDALQNSRAEPRREDRLGAGVLASQAAGANLQLTQDDLEELITRRRAARRSKAVGFCSHCGKPVSQYDSFCPSCGKAVELKSS
jgi:hypothetical protein